MTIVILAIIVLGIGFISQAISQNDPWYGTSRDPFRDNPNFVESRKQAKEICDRQRKLYEERTGKKANW